MAEQGLEVEERDFRNSELVRHTYLRASLYSSISFFLSSVSSAQYLLGVTKSDGTRHSGQDLKIDQ